VPTGLIAAAVAGAVLVVNRQPSGSPGPAATSGAPSAPAPSLVAVTPGSGASGVALDAPVTVTAKTGRLASVEVTDRAGAHLTGALDPTATSWTSNQPLGASTTYLVSAQVVRAGGRSVSSRSRFSTLTPAALVTMSIWPDSGLSVGVGQPIVLKLSQPVTDPGVRQALLSRLHVSASTPVPIGAYWFSDRELHLRPQSLWPSGERISFSAALDGWDAGGGNWGRGSGAVQFSVGDARVSTADLSTHKLTVTDNGRVVATYPISAGSATYPTMNGVHIVLDRQSKVQMVSSSVGIPVNSPAGYNETVYWDVHISDSGEYVHAAPWSVAAQGYENVSHGCVNLNPTNAEQFFGFSRVGDIVYVVGGPRQPVPGDHGVMDWTTPWPSWTQVPVAQLS
jgi:lipoprotein-anchoring transpeptidase ErfK/SrfK